MKLDRRRLRRLLPSPLRHLLYELGPSRGRRWRQIPGIVRARTGSMVLTFDDGPDDRGTPAVLRALDAEGVKATFFVLGSRVRELPDLTREIRDRGHDLALHGMTHRPHDHLLEAEARAELEAGLAAIEEATGERPRWYRPPFGRPSEALGAACRALELELVYWSSWGYDWEPQPASRIARRVVADLDPGAIVLLHDSARYAERDDPAPTAEALAPIVRSAREAGLSPMPLSAAVDG